MAKRTRVEVDRAKGRVPDERLAMRVLRCEKWLVRVELTDWAW